MTFDQDKTQSRSDVSVLRQYWVVCLVHLRTTTESSPWVLLTCNCVHRSRENQYTSLASVDCNGWQGIMSISSRKRRDNGDRCWIMAIVAIWLVLLSWTEWSQTSLRDLCLTFLTTCCHMFCNLWVDRGFSNTSAAPTSMPLQTQSVMPSGELMRRSGRLLIVCKNCTPSVIAFDTTEAWTRFMVQLYSMKTTSMGRECRAAISLLYHTVIGTMQIGSMGSSCHSRSKHPISAINLLAIA